MRVIHRNVHQIHGKLDGLADRLRRAVSACIERQRAGSGQAAASGNACCRLRFAVCAGDICLVCAERQAGIAASAGACLGVGFVCIIGLHGDIARRDVPGGDDRLQAGIRRCFCDHHGHVHQRYLCAGRYIRQRLHAALCEDRQILPQRYSGIAQLRKDLLLVGGRRRIGADAAQGQLDLCATGGSDLRLSPARVVLIVIVK